MFRDLIAETGWPAIVQILAPLTILIWLLVSIARALIKAKRDQPEAVLRERQREQVISVKGPGGKELNLRLFTDPEDQPIRRIVRISREYPVSGYLLVWRRADFGYDRLERALKLTPEFCAQDPAFMREFGVHSSSRTLAEVFFRDTARRQAIRDLLANGFDSVTIADQRLTIAIWHNPVPDTHVPRLLDNVANHVDALSLMQSEKSAAESEPLRDRIGRWATRLAYGLCVAGFLMVFASIPYYAFGRGPELDDFAKWGPKGMRYGGYAAMLGLAFATACLLAIRRRVGALGHAMRLCVFLPLAFFGATSVILVDQANRWFDRSAATTHKVEVLGCVISQNKSSREFNIYTAPWHPNRASEKLRVRSSFWSTIEEGDTLTITTRRGWLNREWIQSCTKTATHPDDE